MNIKLKQEAVSRFPEPPSSHTTKYVLTCTAVSSKFNSSPCYPLDCCSIAGSR